MTSRIIGIDGGKPMGWFGPSKDEVWRQLGEEMGADLVQGGFWKGAKVQAHVESWTITLDTYTVSTGESHVTYTRMRAPYVNPDGFRFTIYRKGIFSGLGKLLGMQDIEVGDLDFDDAFIIQGTDETKVQKFLTDPKLRALIAAQPQIRLTVKDSEGWFGPTFPDDVDELYFETTGVIKDVERLKRLFDLFAEALERLSRIGSCRKDEPGVAL